MYLTKFMFIGLFGFLSSASPTEQDKMAVQVGGYCSVPGTSDVSSQVSKDCCTKVAGQPDWAYWNHQFLRCLDNRWPTNDIHRDNYTNCCRDRGYEVKFKP